MKRSNMSRVLPYEIDYSILEKCRTAGKIGLYVIGAISVLSPIINNIGQNAVIKTLENVTNYLNFIFIIAYYILNIVTETFLYPATARKRRRGFIDNSLGTKYLTKPVEGYYSNDEIEQGAFKMMVNCCENCYFTYNIAKGMLLQIIVKNGIFTFIFLTAAYFGFENSLIALPILQILLSSLFITELIHHINFITKLKAIFENFISSFSIKKDEQLIFQDAILFFLDYETTLAYNKAPLSNVVYEKLNEKLSKEWEEIKKRYDIKQ